MNQHAHCYIFAAGPFYGTVALPQPDDYIIAADGGYHWCVQEGLSPHLLVGDFDSLDAVPPGIKTLSFPVEKDDTDTMLAIKTALDLGYRTFHLYGCTGGRLDHTIGNLQALSYLAHHHAKGFLYGERETYTAIRNAAHHFPARNDGTFSVFCLGPDALGVSIQGAQYPLMNHTLSAHIALGVSNHFIGNPVTVSVAQGTLVIGWNDLSQNV